MSTCSITLPNLPEVLSQSLWSFAIKISPPLKLLAASSSVTEETSKGAVGLKVGVTVGVFVMVGVTVIVGVGV